MTHYWRSNPRRGVRIDDLPLSYKVEGAAGRYGYLILRRDGSIVPVADGLLHATESGAIEEAEAKIKALTANAKPARKKS